MGITRIDKNSLKLLESKFWLNVTKTDSCWIWNKYLDKDGYGEFKFNLNNIRYDIRSHRVSYFYKTDVYDPSIIVRHTCDNPKCVNPDHLLGGTHADNSQDKVDRNRQAKGIENGRYIHGKYTKENKILTKELNKLKIPKPKLKENYSIELILKIKEEIKKGTKTKEICKSLNINKYLISDIKRERSFKNI